MALLREDLPQLLGLLPQLKLLVGSDYFLFSFVQLKLYGWRRRLGVHILHRLLRSLEVKLVGGRDLRCQQGKAGEHVLQQAHNMRFCLGQPARRSLASRCTCRLGRGGGREGLLLCDCWMPRLGRCLRRLRRRGHQLDNLIFFLLLERHEGIIVRSSAPRIALGRRRCP